LEYGSETLARVVKAFCRLPGIGEKSAQRIALYLLQDGRDEGDQLVRAVQDLQEKVHACSICNNLTETDPCVFCRDPKRDGSIICVVEDARDVMAIERAGGFWGKYHVLGGLISPLDGVGEKDLKIAELTARLDREIREVILATNPTVEGEMTAAHLSRLLKPLGVKITRIARGIPFGGSLEFNDAVTVSKALEGRSEMID
jgi:recombination protein RecR